MMKPCIFPTKNVIGTLVLAMAFCAPQHLDAQTPSREEELRTEALMQFDRIEGLRNGQIPKSKFATLDHAWHPEALYQTTFTDTDPLDIVMRRTRALFDDLSKLPGNETSRFKDDLIRFEMTVRKTKDPEERKKVYMDLVQFRRELAFSNPLLDFDRILFVKHKKNPRNEPFGDHMAGQYYGIHATKENEGLFILENAFGDSPTANNLLEGKMPEGAYLSPELSFDGNKILFAFTEAAGYKPTVCAEEDTAGYYSYSGFESSFTDKNAWHIFSVNTDGTELKQLTHGVFNDFDPCWLPSGQIVFISDRRGGFGRCHMGYDGGAPWFSYTLHRMNADGSKMERLSHHETCEWHPSILHDGMIVYTRWDYVDRGFFQAHHPWTTTPDGRNAIALHGNYPLNWYDRPCMEMEIRAIPGSQKLMALATAHHGQAYGSIVIVDPNVDDNDAMSNVKIVTPDERFPESEYGYFCREASYSTPWPLSENYYLCVFGYPDPTAEDKSVENYGIYLLDAFGNLELIYRDPKIACLSPIPLKARPTPPVIPDQVQPLPVDMNQKRWNLDRPHLLTKAKKNIKREKYDPGIVSIMNVYESRRQWPDSTKIKELRIIQVLPKSTPGRNNPPIGYGTEKNARFVLGTVPVEEDGSVNFYLKPYVPVFFQALDEKGRAVLSMRSDIYVAPNENLSCIGCHDDRKMAPPLHSTAIVMKRKPSTIKPEMDGTAPFNYPRLVQPIWDKHCVSCHGAGTKLDLTGTIDEDHWSVSYRNLRPYAFFYDGQGGYVESKTYPGKFGAMASPLYYLLEQGHKGVELSPEEMRRVAIWLDCNSDFYGTYEDTEAQKRGEVVFPIME